jgi:ribosomal-protein-alanine N-acetyltransferase
VKAPERVETPRLVLRRPRVADADAVYERYASDEDVSRYLAWHRHTSPDVTRRFLQWSDTEWERWPAGPYLIEKKDSGELIGGTGYAFETRYRASTGYVLAKDAWGQGYAAEAVCAQVVLAESLGIVRLYALCHTEHRRSARVLEKCGFDYEGVLKNYLEFPNLAPGAPADCRCYARILR